MRECNLYCHYFIPTCSLSVKSRDGVVWLKWSITTKLCDNLSHFLVCKNKQEELFIMGQEYLFVNFFFIIIFSLVVFLVFSYFSHNYYLVAGCSGMFQVPGFIEGPFNHSRIRPVHRSIPNSKFASLIRALILTSRSTDGRKEGRKECRVPCYEEEQTTERGEK